MRSVVNKSFITAGLLALALGGCASTGELTPAAQASVTAAFNRVCPVVSSGALDPLAGKFNANVRAAYASAKSICANGAPTNIVVAGLDIIAVEPILEPYLAKIKVK